MKELRAEIMQAQKTRYQLIQWKLVIVSALGATGLGLAGSKAIPNSELVLCCIPFACIYADALIYHQSILCHVIGEFLRTREQSPTNEELKIIIAYEDFALSARHLKTTNGSEVSAYEIERATLHVASMILSAVVMASPLFHHNPYWPALALSGIIGLFGSYFLRRSYIKRRTLLRPNA